MKPLLIETERLRMIPFTPDMAAAVHLNSLDEDNRRFVPDEVFETIEDARDTIGFLIGRYDSEDGPFVYPILLKTGENIGYVQIAQIDHGWEIGYHVAKHYTGHGYATEAVRAFLPVIAAQHLIPEIYGICLAENTASVRVMQKSGFQQVLRGAGVYQGQECEIVKCVWRSHPDKRSTAYAGAMIREAQTVRNSLRCFDNHDSRIPYYELMLEQELTDIPEVELPKGYHYENYQPGDREAWITLEMTAKEFASYAEGEEAWQRYYAGREKELETRMFFVVDESGQKRATATAFYDIRTGDNGQTGWLHWVAVRRDAQGKGLSKPLITHTLQYMKKRGYSRAVIPTQTTTWLACKVYLDLGFRPIPQNAERNRIGWEIVKTLTNHPALEKYESTDLRKILGLDQVKLDGKEYL